MIESDADLLARTAAGDRQAFTTFVGRHQAAAFRYLRNLTRHDADAEDVLQETFLAVWRSAGSFAGTDSARGWLLTIARHAASRLRRRRVGEPDRFESIETIGLEAGWGEIPSPDVELDRMSQRELIERALAALPDAERETVVLRDLESLPGEQVAELTGVSVAAMKSRLHRGRLRLAALLKESSHG